MRILFVLHTWHPEGRGGSEHHAREVALALQARGHQVGVFTAARRPGLGRYEVSTETQESMGVTRINNLFWDSPTFEWIYKNRWVHEAFVRELDEFKPDLVHIHHFVGLSTTIVEALKRRGIPVVMTLHDFWTVCPRGQRMTSDLELCWEVDREKCFSCLGGMWPHLFREREQVRTVTDIRGDLSPEMLADFDRHMAYMLNLCDRLITPSEFHRERMLDFPLEQDRIVSLPHGLDTGAFTGPAREVRRPRVIGFIGTVIPIKGVHVLVEAFKLLNRPDLLLNIHGERRDFHEDVTYQRRMDEMVSGMEGVTFTGTYDPVDVPDLLADIDILVVPSLWWETYCLTIREGLLAGVPVVAPDLGAMREALDGEQDGVLYRPGDAEDLARKLAGLLDDDVKRARYSNRGGSVKSMRVYVDELESVYSDAMRLSAESAPGRAVAPSCFPEDPKTVEAGTEEAPAAREASGSLVVPWDELGVAVRHHGPLGLSFQTRMPTDEEPALGLDILLTEGETAKGKVGVVIDLRALKGSLARPPELDVESAKEVRLTRKIVARNGRQEPYRKRGSGVRRIVIATRKRRRSIRVSPRKRRMERLVLGDETGAP